jgi:outer membrane protein TolC
MRRHVSAILLAVICLGPLGCRTTAPAVSHDAAPARPTTTPQAVEPSSAPVAAPSDSAEQATAPSIGDILTGTTQDRSIDLGGALSLAGAANPTIAIAIEAVRASQARQLDADTLLLPTLHGGMDFDLHHGNLLASGGVIRADRRESLYAGAGSAVVGAGTLGIPGAQLIVRLADAVYEPRVARQEVVNRKFTADATRNDVLLRAVDLYLALVAAEERLAAIRHSEEDFGAVARLTADFARVGQGRDADAQRARTALLLLQDDEARAQEEIAVSSADLIRVLDLDPCTRLRPEGGPLPLLTLVSTDLVLDQLVQLAQNARPEVGAAIAAVDAATARLHEERARPFLPLVIAGASAGDFGGGSDQVTPRFGKFAGRTDFDIAAVWTLENFGFGNLAVQRQRRAQLGQAEAERARVIDQVRREVADASAEAAARRREVDIATTAVRRAEQAYREDLQRTRNLQGLPIEVLDSAQLLTTARLQLILATVAYDQAEFRLFVALGQPPTLAPGASCVVDHTLH